MVQRMPSGEVMVRRMLNNQIALQQAIIDADSTLAQNVQRNELKQYFNQFKPMDQKHLDNYRQVFQSIGGGPGSPDRVTQSLINECKQVFGDPNASDIEKTGLYNLLLFSAKDGSGLLAHYGAVKGNQHMSRLMSECFHEDVYHGEAISTEAHKEIGQLS